MLYFGLYLRLFFHLGLVSLIAVQGGAVVAQTSVPHRVQVDPELSVVLEREGEVTAFVLLDVQTSGVRSSRERQRLFRDARRRFRASLPFPGCVFDFEFRRSPVCGVTLTSKEALNTLASSTRIAAIGPDERGGGALEESRQAVGADRVTEEFGVTGEGVVVAVLDTGINSQHPDFSGTILKQVHFLDRGRNVGRGAEDDNRHGSNIASILTSRGTQTPAGIAPGVRTVVVKVLDEYNRGWVSDWVRGVDYVVDIHERALAGQAGGVFIDVLNMSLASDEPFTSICDDTLEPVFRAFGEACRAAVDLGIVVFAASGNDGQPDAVASPGCYASVISVGSVRDMAPYGISRFSNLSSFLDLVAPGETIEGVGLGTGMSRLAGTSQATAHASAVACLVLEVQPAVTPAEMRDLLKRTSVPVEDSRSGASYSRVVAFDAVEAAAAIRPELLFRRGDCNDDDGVNIADAVRLLLGLFRGIDLGEGCPRACDTDDDGVLAVDDAIGLLLYLFSQGAPPVRPFRRCGLDSTPDDLSCGGGGSRHCDH